MSNCIGVLIPNEIELAPSAVDMPITIYGQPIGYIMAVDDQKISALLWTHNIEVQLDECGDVSSIELMGDGMEDICFGDDGS